MSLLEFRIALESDLEKIVATYNSTVASQIVTADLEPVSVESKKNWFDAHNPETRPLYCIYKDGMYCGWMSFNSFYGRPAYNGTAELSIYLEESCRGKGVGKDCLAHALKICPQLKIINLLGFIFGHNMPSLQLFEKFGFEKWAHLPKVANMNGVERDLIILGKRVS